MSRPSPEFYSDGDTGDVVALWERLYAATIGRGVKPLPQPFREIGDERVGTVVELSPA